MGTNVILYCPDYTVLNRFIMHYFIFFNIMCKKKRRGRDSPYRYGHRFRILQAASLTGARHPCRPSPVCPGVRSDRIPEIYPAIMQNKSYYFTTCSKKNGEGGIRTLGTRNGYNSLAGSPIQPLSHLSS